MAASGEDELFCDFAETYHILDWRALPLKTAARLAAGLPQDCRVRRKLCGLSTPLSTLLLAGIADRLSLLSWALSGGSGDQPPLLTEKLTQGKKDAANQIHVFNSPEDFRAQYAIWTGGESK